VCKSSCCYSLISASQCFSFSVFRPRNALPQPSRLKYLQRSALRADVSFSSLSPSDPPFWSSCVAASNRQQRPGPMRKTPTIHFAFCESIIGKVLRWSRGREIGSRKGRKQRRPCSFSSCKSDNRWARKRKEPPANRDAGQRG
jgi:hypothetical protein